MFFNRDYRFHSANNERMKMGHGLPKWMNKKENKEMRQDFLCVIIDKKPTRGTRLDDYTKKESKTPEKKETTEELSLSK